MATAFVHRAQGSGPDTAHILHLSKACGKMPFGNDAPATTGGKFMEMSFSDCDMTREEFEKLF